MSDAVVLDTGDPTHHRAVERKLERLRGRKLTYVDASSLVFSVTTNRRVACRARSRRRLARDRPLEDPQRSVAGNSREILIGSEQGAAVLDHDLGDQRVDGGHRDAATEAAVTQPGSGLMGLPARIEHRKRAQPADEIASLPV